MTGSFDEGASAPRAQVLLVDDHPIVRQGVARLIDRQDDLAVWAEAATIAEALALVESTPPDVAVVDLMLDGGSGIDLIQTLHHRFPALPIVVLSMHEERLYADRVLRAGARGYVMKRESPARILCVIRLALQGGLAFSADGLAKAPSLQSPAAQAEPSGNPQLEAVLAHLSDRELEIFEYLRQGYSRRQIAELMQRQFDTINAYCTNILIKLDLEDLTELATYALTPSSEAPLPTPVATPATHYYFEDYMLDTTRRELSRAGAPVALEPKVYQVLLYLVQHADRLVTRQELLDAIWSDMFVQDAVVSRCIREVRQALGDDRSAQRMVQTRPGQGYRFVSPVRPEIQHH